MRAGLQAAETLAVAEPVGGKAAGMQARAAAEPARARGAEARGFGRGVAGWMFKFGWDGRDGGIATPLCF
jgi:hypothetical protein